METSDRALRRAESRLELPEPDRSRLLLELSRDLEDLSRAFRERGMEPGEARKRAARWLELSPESARHLADIHASLPARLLGRVPGIVRSRLERAVLAVLTLLAVGGALASLWSARVLWPPVPGVVAVLALGAAGVWSAGRRALELYTQPGDRLDPWEPRRALPVLAAATVLAGQLAGAVRVSIASGTASPGNTIPWDAIAVAAGTAALGLGVGMLLALAWLLLHARAESIRRIRLELDGEEQPW